MKIVKHQLRDIESVVEKVPQLTLVAVQGSGYKQARAHDAGVHRYLRRPATHDGKPLALGNRCSTTSVSKIRFRKIICCV
jgi:response regulator RpfG family c-di-GMP phosphodiesterase